MRVSEHSAGQRLTSPPAPSGTTNDVNAIMALEKAAHASPYKEDELDHLCTNKEFFLDVAGKTFRHAMIVEARKLEMKFFRKIGLHTKIENGERLSQMAAE